MRDPGSVDDNEIVHLGLKEQNCYKIKIKINQEQEYYQNIELMNRLS